MPPGREEAFEVRRDEGPSGARRLPLLGRLDRGGSVERAGPGPRAEGGEELGTARDFRIAGPALSPARGGLPALSPFPDRTLNNSIT